MKETEMTDQDKREFVEQLIDVVGETLGVDTGTLSRHEMYLAVTRVLTWIQGYKGD